MSRNLSVSGATLVLALASCAAPARTRPSVRASHLPGGGSRSTELRAQAPGGDGGTGEPPLVEPLPPAEEKGREGPWRLDQLLGVPDWLELDFEQQSRYETFDENYRAGTSGEGHAFVTRTTLAATARSDDWRATLEVIDGRQFGASDDLALNTSIVDSFDLLQAKVGYHATGVLTADDELDVQVGRQTLDLGSRRLVARNLYRNTINSFTGALGQWDSGAGDELTAFAFAPVNRLPNEQSLLEDNETEADEELQDTLFYGLFAARPVRDGRASLETYFYGLDERDEPDVATRDRELYTLGARLFEKADPGGLGYEWESVYQFGSSRASAADADTRDLDHSAWFHHLSLGYRFDGPMRSLVEGVFDYASGDENPGDGDYNRFDTLYGVPRGDYGPTSLFGAFGRENSLSPGVRWQFDPDPRTNVMLFHRVHYLASDRDAWVRGGLVDPAGESGSYVGQLFEARVRHELVPDNLRLEAGYAHFFPGDFVEDAPGSGGSRDTNYFWIGFNLYL